MISAPKKVINAWCMYDWANSAYNLVITSTIFPTYFVAITSHRLPGNEVGFLGRKFINTALYNYALAAAFIVVTVMSPILTSIADTRGNKKNFMRLFCTIGSLACAGLYFFSPVPLDGGGTSLSSASLHFGVICMSVSCIGYWVSLVFYNSYLPDLVEESMRDKVSAKGFMLGYIGSVLLQIICFIIVFFPESFGLTTPFQKNFMPARISFVLVGIWWFAFAQIPFRLLPKGNATVKVKSGNAVKTGFLELKKVWRQVKTLPVLKRFLYSFFWYSAGIQTVFLAAAQFGAKELHLSDAKLIITIMIIQLVAIPGSALISTASVRFGNFPTLIATTLLWVALCFLAYFITTDVQFYILGAVVGLVMGGIQSVSRSTYANLMPETKDTASFFSFFDITEKVALVIGMFSFGYVEELTGSMRNSVLALMSFFILGSIFLVWTNQTQKRLKLATA